MDITEGMEWNDGMFAYIAYRKADGRMVVRDLEGFDYSLEQWLDILADRTDDEPDDLVEVDTDLEGYVKIERWEGEVETLPR